MALYEWRWPYDLAGLPPGEHTVQARYWVVMIHRSIGDSTITWRPDGTPTPPPNTLGMIPLQATTTITVPQQP